MVVLRTRETARLAFFHPKDGHLQREEFTPSRFALGGSVRLLGLDIGEVRIGVAVCDSLEIAAFPVGLVRRVGSLKRDVAAVAALAVEQEAEGIVVGLPLSLDGGVGPQAQRTQGFAKALSNVLPVPIAFWDESLTSVEAEELLIAQGVSRAKRRDKIDQTAAALILDSYLQHRRTTNAPRDILISG